MQAADALRLIVPAGLAVLAAWALDRQSARRGLTPPGFAVPWRRTLASACVAGVLWIGVTLPLGGIGKEAPPTDFSTIPTPQLFLLHILMVVAVLAWFLLGFARAPAPPPPPEPVAEPEPEPDLQPMPVPALEPASEVVVEAVDPYAPPASAVLAPLAVTAEPPPPPAPAASLGRRFAEQLGLVAPSVPNELGLGVLLGIAAWVVVLAGVMAIGLILYALGGEKALPKEPPAMVTWIAALPILVRMAISLSAGIVDEGFFRGFLQPRVGILASTALFVLAHFSYGQPFMLVGIAILSLIYALLVRWRQNIWPAIAAHTLFDGVQLLVVIPGVLKLIQTQTPKTAALLGFW
jgi:membrane protease YdiL (CAAX protease family)